MNVADNLLLQQMQNAVSLPKTGGTGGAGGRTGSFQDLMSQAGQDKTVDTGKDTVKDTGKDTGTTSQPARNEKPDSTAAEDSGGPVEKQDGEKVEESLIDPSAAAALVMELFRPEIVEVQPEAAPEAAAALVEAAAPVEEAAVEIPVVETAEAPVQVEAAPAEEAAPVEIQEAVVQKAPETAVETAEPVEAKPAAEEVPQETAAVEVEKTTDTGELKDVRPAEETAEENDAPQGEGADLAEPVFRDVEAAPVKVAGNYQTVDTQKPEMDGQLAGMIQDAAQNGVEKVQIQLTPANLGAVTIELTRHEDGALQVVIHASTNKAAGLLTQHLDGLHAALQSYGGNQPISVEVQRGQESQEQHMFQQADPDGRGRQQHHQQQDRRENEDSGEDFLQKLRLGLTGLEN